MPTLPPIVHRAISGKNKNPRCGATPAPGDSVSTRPGEENCLYCLNGLVHGQIVHHSENTQATCGSTKADEIKYVGDWCDVITCEACWENAPDEDVNERHQRRHRLFPARCPECLSDNIVGHPVDVHGGTAEQECGCDDCLATWYDVYELREYRPIIEGGTHDKEEDE